MRNPVYWILFAAAMMLGTGCQRARLSVSAGPTHEEATWCWMILSRQTLSKGRLRDRLRNVITTTIAPIVAEEKEGAGPYESASFPVSLDAAELFGSVRGGGYYTEGISGDDRKAPKLLLVPIEEYGVCDADNLLYVAILYGGKVIPVALEQVTDGDLSSDGVCQLWESADGTKLRVFLGLVGHVACSGAAFGVDAWEIRLGDGSVKRLFSIWGPEVSTTGDPISLTVADPPSGRIMTVDVWLSARDLAGDLEDDWRGNPILEAEPGKEKGVHFTVLGKYGKGVEVQLP